MKFITFETPGGTQSMGILLDQDHAVDLYEASNKELPNNLLDFLINSDENTRKARALLTISRDQAGVYPLRQLSMKAPIPTPISFRDFYAFEQHVKTARGNRGLEMVPEWYEMPVFYFSNHLAMKGPNEDIIKPLNSDWLDYELEIACVIGKEGRNICAEEAEDYIFGYCILNDWSARDLQRKEMKVGLGPAKGKDFATSIGPWITTKEELEPYRLNKGFNLSMKAYLNGSLLSEGNMADLYFSFAEMIERASIDVTLYPGEIIGSGTVGTGCILELGTKVHQWLKPGDVVELEIQNLGVLRNKIVLK
jgi:2-keto-4-pentenoate hydratase/2-oxohepta-3-ene-1,7-dioic acid hydratase in catechol pathway